MTLNELMDFAKWIVFDADVQRNESCNCHAEYRYQHNLIEQETARWWREHEKGNSA